MSKKKHANQKANTRPSGLPDQETPAARRESSPAGQENAGEGVRAPAPQHESRPQTRFRPIQEVDPDQFNEELREAASKVVFMLETAGWKDIVAPYLEASRQTLSDVSGIDSMEQLVANRAAIQFIDQFIATLEDAKLQGEIAQQSQ